MSREQVGARTHRITHRTVYDYSDEVSSSYGRVWLRPRELADQQCLHHELTLDPGADDLSTGRDVYGNEMAYFHVTTPHTHLEVTGTSLVRVLPPDTDPAATALAWEAARPTGVHGRPVLDLVLDQRDPALLARAREYAAPSFAPGTPIGAAVQDLLHRVHTEFTYVAGSTSVRTGLDEVLDARQGVCQDFARLSVACLRSLGLAGRYVSGYLATDPPAGRDRVVGADATHAWAAVWLPSARDGAGEWLGFDPTNDHLADERYATLAWGRDYADVPPVRGIVFTDAETSTMTVSVDVAPVDVLGTDVAPVDVLG